MAEISADKLAPDRREVAPLKSERAFDFFPPFLEHRFGLPVALAEVRQYLAVLRLDAVLTEPRDVLDQFHGPAALRVLRLPPEVERPKNYP